MSKYPKRLYLVLNVETHVSVQTREWKQTVPLTSAEGMVGLIPAFSDIRKARAYANGHEIMTVYAKG